MWPTLMGRPASSNPFIWKDQNIIVPMRSLLWSIVDEIDQNILVEFALMHLIMKRKPIMSPVQELSLHPRPQHTLWNRNLWTDQFPNKNIKQTVKFYVKNSKNKNVFSHKLHLCLQLTLLNHKLGKGVKRIFRTIKEVTGKVLSLSDVIIGRPHNCCQAEISHLISHKLNWLNISERFKNSFQHLFSDVKVKGSDVQAHRTDIGFVDHAFLKIQMSHFKLLCGFQDTFLILLQKVILK